MEISLLLSGVLRPAKGWSVVKVLVIAKSIEAEKRETERDKITQLGQSIGYGTKSAANFTKSADL